MNKLVPTIFMFAILLSGCKNPFEAQDTGVDQLNKIENRWEDAHTLASSTARIALAVPVSELQGIKRELAELEVSDCLKPAKESLDSYMSSHISNFLNFMADTDSLNTHSNTKIVEYFSIKRKCTGENIQSNSKLAAEAEALEIIIEAEAKLAADRNAKIDAEVKSTGATRESIVARMELEEESTKAASEAEKAASEATKAASEAIAALEALNLDQ